MDAATTSLVRALVADSQFGGQIVDFGRILRRSAVRSSRTTASGLLLVGTPASEPWHLAAHLSDEARLTQAPELMPMLLRWNPPAGAPAHLSMSLQRLEDVRRGETLLIIAPDAAPAALLERVADARRSGATVLAVDSEADELNDLAHESLVVSADPTLDRIDAFVGADIETFDVVQHLVSASAADAVDGRASRGLRQRLARALDVMTGAAPTGS